MQKNLRQKFFDYVTFVRQNFNRQDQKVGFEGEKKILSLVTNPIRETKRKVEETLSVPEFNKLRDATRIVYSPAEELKKYLSHRYFYSERESELIENKDLWWTVPIYNFFRRSGFYLKCCNGIDFEAEKLFEQYCAEFGRKEIKMTYLAPMEGVFFNNSGCVMDFKDFQIRKFKGEEFQRVFSSDVTKIFYPELSFSTTDLMNGWFIFVEDKVLIKNLIKDMEREDLYGDTESSINGVICSKYTNFPVRIETILKSIVLYNWQNSSRISRDLLVEIFAGLNKEEMEGKINDFEKRARHAWDKFKIPFILRANDYLLDIPESQAKFQGSYDLENCNLVLGTEEVSSFNSFLNKIKRLIDSLDLKSEKLEFLNIALGQIMKAFFSEGFEDLLSNMVAMEALLGPESKKDITETIADRLSTILGGTKEQREEIRENFISLYRFRCQIVHGRKVKSKAYEGHLREAREFVRKTILAIINYINFYQTSVKAGEIRKPLDRSKILKAIDMGKVIYSEN